MTVDRLTAALRRDSATWRIGRAWFVRAAMRAIAAGEFRVIAGRRHDAVYLARFWLSPMLRLSDGSPDSGDSLLLHWIARDDDDGALHDHPWAFETRVVSGGYVEQQPDGGQFTTFVGTTLRREATDLHRVTRVRPDTWTLVETGPKVRTWGFVRPGGAWTPWREFLGVEAGASQ